MEILGGTFSLPALLRNIILATSGGSYVLDRLAAIDSDALTARILRR